MPKVGGKHFAYTKAGEEAAKTHAAETGQKVEQGGPYMKKSGFKMKSSPAKLWPWSKKAKANREARRMQKGLDRYEEEKEEEIIAQQETDDLELDRKWKESLSQMSNEDLEAARTMTREERKDFFPQPKTDKDIAEEQRIADIKAKYAERKALREGSV